MSDAGSASAMSDAERSGVDEAPAVSEAEPSGIEEAPKLSKQNAKKLREKLVAGKGTEAQRELLARRIQSYDASS